MGGSASSQLDEGKCAYIRGKTEAAIKNFGPYYSRQYSVAFGNHVRSEVEQQRDLTSQFLKTKPPLEPGTVLYEAELAQFAEGIRKWKDRYVVVKNDFAVESYENREAYQKGAAPKSRILPAGGKVLTSEDEYNLLSDRHFPDPIASSEKENAQPLVVLPRPFPVYLWQPFLRHSYFCFHEAADQKKFSTLLSDCVRHLNHDYTKQTTFEAQAFLEAVQFFRQEKGHYGSWEMIIGDEIQVTQGSEFWILSLDEVARMEDVVPRAISLLTRSSWSVSYCAPTARKRPGTNRAAQSTIATVERAAPTVFYQNTLSPK
uniref:Niban apoptosis regulator 1 n=1 Tax=Sciurus vulgaris TaxID=55149 RepID=A0A8D2B4X3_SCIVU